MTSCGIFIRSGRDDSEFRRECLAALSRLIPSSNITSSHKQSDGFTVCFKDEESVSKVLKAKRLRIAQEYYPMYAMTTILIVHAGLPGCDEKFENYLRKAMSQIGPIAELKKLPFSEDFPNIFSGDWKVVLKVPEIEDLDIFTVNGLLENMVLKLPVLGGSYQVNFRCSFCGEDGHTLHGCPKCELLSDFEEDESSRMSPTPNLRLPDFKEEVDVPQTKQSKPSVLLEDIVSTAGSEIGEEVVKQRLATDDHNTVFKQKPAQYSAVKSPLKRSGIGHRSSCGSEDAKRFAASTSGRRNHCSDNNEQLGTFSRPQCSTSDDEITIIGETLTASITTNNSISSSNSTAATGSNCPDESGQVSTSSLPEEAHDPIKSELSSDDSDSNGLRAQSAAEHTPQRRKKPTHERQIIPDGIKEIILENQTVLTASQLEAFFNHVKKKACPSDVAKQYTKNIQGLKDQLQKIKDHYYSTPVIRNADERYFMKWFENVLNRYDRKLTKKTKQNP